MRGQHVLLRSDYQEDEMTIVRTLFFAGFAFAAALSGSAKAGESQQQFSVPTNQIRAQPKADQACRDKCEEEYRECVAQKNDYCEDVLYDCIDACYGTVG
jgi:hypothetical protein